MANSAPPGSPTQDPNITISFLALFYNEEACVEKVIREGLSVLQRIGEPFEIIAIQNGSLDGTPAILERLSKEIPELRRLIIPVNQGAGYGARLGWYAGRGKYLIGVSGDGQVDLQSIPGMFKLLRDTGCDLAYGKRRTRPDGARRALISKLYKFLMRAAFGIQSQDMNGPPKILTWQAFRAMSIVSTDHFFECEMMIKAARMGLRICATDVNFYGRDGGSSSVGWRDIASYLGALLRIRTRILDRWHVRDVPRIRPHSEWFYFPDGAPAATVTLSPTTTEVR